MTKIYSLTLVLATAALVAGLGCSGSRPRPVDQSTIQLLMQLLYRFEDNTWTDTGIDRLTLVEGLKEIYETAVATSDSELRIRVIYAMGDSGLIEFYPVLLSAIEFSPFLVCLTLCSMPTDDAVPAVIPYLNDDSETTRSGAIWALGGFPYYAEYPHAGEEALTALYNRLEMEPEDWLRDEIADAIATIESQLALNCPPGYSPTPD